MTRRDEPAARRSTAKARIAPGRGLGLLLAILCLLTVVGASTALADDTDAPAQDAESFVPGWTSQEAQEEAAEESPPEVFAPPTDSQAAETLPHDDLGRGEASELLTAVFGEVLDEAAGIFDELEVEQFRSDYVAVVGAEGPDAPSGDETGEPGLLTSLLPLRAENSEGQKAQIDLDLQQVAGDFLSENPLVEVEIPGEIGQGISLPEAGVTVDVAGAPADRTASALEGSAAFYPNVAPDSDLTVLPTPTGFETSTVLRTPDAPLTQTFGLTIPPGAHLESTPEGGASVIKGEETLLSVRTPTAIDAEGDPVAVTLEVAGNSIVLHTSPSEEDSFPILVDPIYETYFWNQYPGSESPEWIPNSSPCFVAQWRMWMSEGMTMYSCSNEWVTPGSQATWNYYVPRFFTDMNDPLVKERPTSYIKSMTMSALTFTLSGAQPDPHIILGIWSEAKSAWVSVASQNGAEGQVVNKSLPFYNSNEVTDAKNAGIALASYEPYLPGQRNVIVGQATVEISDKDYPTISEKANPTQWVNNSPTSPITFKATDKGLGMYSLVVGEKKSNGQAQYIETRYKNCNGSARVPCPRSWSSAGGPSLNYDPSILPQGENWVTLEPVDPLNHRQDPATPALSEVKIKVDHSPPALGLSGTLTEQAKVGTTASQYSLNYAALDGDHETATAQTPFGVTGTGIGQMQAPAGIAVDSSGNSWVVDRACRCVQKYDASGTFISQFGSAGTGNGQFSDPRGIAITSTGKIWVSDPAGKRVQQFSAAGAYLRKSTYGQFVEPYGLAVGPADALWVSDIGSDKALRFAEGASEPNALLSGTAGSPGGAATDFATPASLATDPTGRVAVADFDLNRVEVFDANGKFVTQFGVMGIGNGQFKNPLGISVAPSGNFLVADASNNRVQVFQPNGTYLRKFGATGAANDQFAAPRGLALRADGTVLVPDEGNRRVSRWSHADLNVQSGVTKVEVKVDNEAPKVFYDQACAERDCPKSDALLFNSSFYPTGQHKVIVTATDGVKLTTPKELVVNTVKDTTKPALTATSPFFTAPEGWVEQKSYSYVATAKDSGGYEVTSLELKIDGKTVSSSSQACPNGGCERILSGTINMSSYKGGAHPAELFATDGAGLKEKKVWTVNVAPKGTIPAAEAEDTIEAAEETSGEAILLPAPETQTPEEEEQPPILSQDGEEISSENTFVESTMTTDPSKGFQLLTSEGLVSITPVGTGGTPTQPTPGGEAGVSGNTGPGVDTSFRPIYDGGLQFQQIRTIAAPEEYTWKVNMFDDQVLQQIDARTAEVDEIDEQEVKHPAFSIRAEFAHDAVGTAVPTSLTVSGTNLITLKVQYRAGNPAAGGAPFVYPITAGTGWEGGFVTEYVDIFDELPNGQIEDEEGEVEISPPERVSPETAGVTSTEAQQYDALTSGTPLRTWREKIDHHSFRWIQCKRLPHWPDPVRRPGGSCGNPFLNQEGYDDVAFNYGLRGDYYVVPGVWAKHRGGQTDNIECAKKYNQGNIEDQGLLKETYFINNAQQCKWYGVTKYSREPGALNENGNSHHITPYGEWNWGAAGDPGKGGYVTHQEGLALYIWTTATGYIGHHHTTCIDC